MKDNIDNKISCKDTINFKVGFTFFLYIICFLVYYFVGIKSNDKERKNYNDLPIFLTIILYIYHCYILYSYTLKKSKIPCSSIIWLHISVFYIQNLVIMYYYFNPLEKGNDKYSDEVYAKEIDKAAAEGDIDRLNALNESIKNNKWGIFIGSSIFGLFGLVIGALTFIPKFENILPKGSLLILFKLIAVLFVFFGLLFITGYFFTSTPWSLTLIINILNIGILIGLLSIIYTLGKSLFANNDTNSQDTNPSLLKLLKLIVFYIPCLFIDLIEYIKKQFGLTKRTAYIILLIEFIIIGLRFFIPFIYKNVEKVTEIQGIILNEGPIYTNQETDLGIFQNYNNDISNLLLNKKSIFNYNYSLSCSIWINPQPPSTNDAYNKSTTLLNYGNILKINFNKNKIEIFASTTSDTALLNKLVKIYEIKDIAYQKWNNFILNYSGGTLDIFINGQLVSSSINITPVMYYDKVVSGANNGIYGGIKDITYFNKVLSQKQIKKINAK